MVRQLWIL